MATENVFAGDGSANQVFNLTFEYLDDSDIKVEIKDTTSDAAATKITKDATNGWELINPTSVRMKGTLQPASTDNVRIYRETDISNKAVTFAAGSAIRAQDLNKANDQVMFSVEEWRDQRVPRHGAVMPDDFNMGTHQITNLGDANSDDDAVNRKQLGNLIANDLSDDTSQGLQINKSTGGTNSNDLATITIRDSSKTQKGSVTINEGEGIDVAYTNGNAVISGEDSSKTNKGIVTINEAHAIGVAYTNGDAVISADKSTASQQGVIQITPAADSKGNPIQFVRPNDGELTLGIPDNSIDLDKIKDLDILTETEQDQGSPAVTDTNILSAKAVSKRHDIVFQTSGSDPTAPNPGSWQTGKLQYQNVAGSEVLKIWDGSQWKNVSAGVPYTPATQTIVRYVDNVNGDDTAGVTGFLPNQPLKTIQRALALVNASSSGDGTIIHVASGVYKETLPLRIKKNNVSVIGASIRSVFVLPANDTEAVKDMWEVDSGTYLSNMTLLGLKINNPGARNYSLDNDATHGLPTGQNWAIRFRTDSAPTILKSPYVQNCTHFSDAHLDIANFDPNTFPSTDAQTFSAVAGDQTSAPTAGGLLVDGNACAATSPIRSMVVDAFTQITLDGPGILVTNNGYAQLVSFFGTFCHYHAKARNGGQINLSNCVTDFGRFGLIADGHGNTFATATATAANQGATTVTVGALSTTSGHHVTANRPLDHMMVTIDGNDYGVISSTANGSGWNVTITPALTQNISNTSVAFSLRSYISTGGHTFEYVGVGTDYSDHPDKGGVAIEANQTVEKNGGKVWQSSTDQIGKFQVGNVMTVDQIQERLTVAGDLVVNQGQTVSGDVTITGGFKKVNGTSSQFLKADGSVDSTAYTAYGDSDVESLLNRSSAQNNEVLSWTGSAYDWVPQTTGSTGPFDKIEEDNSKVEVVDTGSNGQVQFHTEGSERMRLTNTGQLIIGNSFVAGSAEADDLNITGTGNTGITIRSGTSHNGAIYFADGTSGNDRHKGTIDYDHNVDGLGFWTNFTSSAPNNLPRLWINSNGAVGIGSTNINFNGGSGLQIFNSQSAWLKLNNTSTGTGGTDGTSIYLSGLDTMIENSENAPMRFFTNGQTNERMRIHSDGKVLMGSTFWGGDARLLVAGSANSTTGPGILAINKGNVTIADGTEIGLIRGNGGSTTERRGADIRFLGDGSWTAGSSHPTRISFWTCASSATSPTERMRIDSTGRVQVLGEIEYKGATSAVDATASTTITVTNSAYHRRTVTSNTTFSFSGTFTNNKAYSFMLEVAHQGGTITWPTNVEWPADEASPTLTTGSNIVHLFVLFTSDGGSTWRGAYLADYAT